MPFTFTFPDLPDGLTSDDLTLDEMAAIEAETGEPWIAVNPLARADHALAVLTRFYARGHDLKQGRARAGALTVAQTSAGVHWQKEDDRPIEHRDGIPVVDPKEDTAGSATT